MNIIKKFKELIQKIKHRFSYEYCYTEKVNIYEKDLYNWYKTRFYIFNF